MYPVDKDDAPEDSSYYHRERTVSGTPERQQNPDVMRQRRAQVLATPPAEFGIRPTPEYPRVYGIVMDWPVEDDIATVVSLCDGNASLYSRSGFGVIGGFFHVSVREQARGFVRLASVHHDDALPTSEFPYPESDHVRFYLLSFDGVRVIDADVKAVSSNEHKYTGLFAQGQNVLTELRLITERDPGGSESTGHHRKEWSGEPGYLNCLMTAMSKGIFRSIEIVASRPVPNLIDLTAQHRDTRDWIAAQQFSFESLDAKQVIRVLKQGAGISGLPFFTKRAELPTFHVHDDGSEVARVFDLIIGPFDRFAKIDLAPDNDPRAIALQRETEAKLGRLLQRPPSV